MAGNKEAVVVIVDVGKHSIQQNKKFEDTFLEKQKTYLIKLLQRKMFSAKNDEIALIMMGTDETSNDLNCTMSGYNNICEAIKLSTPNWDTIRKIEKCLVRHNAEADWLDALIVAMDVIERETEVKKFQKLKIILFCTFCTYVNDDNILNVILGIKKKKIKLIVVNDNVEYDMENLNSLRISQTKFQEDPNKKNCKKKNETLINRIIEDTNGYLCNFESVIHHMLKFQRSKTSRQYCWHCDLEIGSSIKIQTTSLINIKEEKHFKWDTESVDKDFKFKTLYEYYSNGVKIFPEKEDLLKAYLLGSTPIVFDESLGLKKENTKKCLKCLGFTSKKYMDDKYMSGNGNYIVLPKIDQKVSEKLFIALFKSMTKLDLVMIATKVHANNGRKKFVVLIPNDTKKYPCFTMIELFYADQFSYYFFPPLKTKKNIQSSEKIQAVEKLVSCMNLNNKENNMSELFPINNLNNIGIQYMYETITKRALNPKYCVPTLDKHLYELLEISPKVKEECSELINSIKNLFSLSETKINDKIKLIRKIGDIPALPEENSEMKENILLNEDKKVVVEVGTVNPTKDFKELIEREENFGILSLQMGKVISDLIFKTIIDETEKIMEAIETFREEAKFYGPYEYDDWIKSIKSQIILTKKFDFWNNVIVKNKFGLIPITESDLSNLSEEECERFYKIEEDNYNNETSEINETENDLFENM